MPLCIPNRSVQAAFRQEVWSFLRDKVSNASVRALARALWSGDEDGAQTALGQILEAVLSFWHEWREYSYHLVLVGLFTGLGYLVQSELESGYGRSDVAVLDPARSRCMVLELKHVRSETDMGEALDEAAGQIEGQRYVSRLAYEGYATHLRYAMAFWDKRARVRAV